MAFVKDDWAQNAATEIYMGFAVGAYSSFEELKNIINKHCPFEQDEAYERVRRPETYGQELVNAMDEERWKDATHILIWKIHRLYTEGTNIDKLRTVQDWAARCAVYLAGDRKMTTERIAAVIATFAAPILEVIRDSKRIHHHDENSIANCCPQCACLSWSEDEEADVDWTPNTEDACTCGATAWNARVNTALE